MMTTQPDSPDVDETQCGAMSNGRRWTPTASCRASLPGQVSTLASSQHFAYPAWLALIAEHLTSDIIETSEA
jgi:hypothetical protein